MSHHILTLQGDDDQIHKIKSFPSSSDDRHSIKCICLPSQADHGRDRRGAIVSLMMIPHFPPKKIKLNSRSLNTLAKQERMGMGGHLRSFKRYYGEGERHEGSFLRNRTRIGRFSHPLCSGLVVGGGSFWARLKYGERKLWYQEKSNLDCFYFHV